MNLDLLNGADETTLRHYLEFLLRHYRVADSFWFLFTAEQFDQPTAEALNERVWEKAGSLAAREIVKQFGITQKGLSGFVKALRLYPWHLIIGYAIEERENDVLITVPHCPTQEARLKRGLGEYACKEMHRREFVAFAHEIDKRITVDCLFAPPDAHPENMFCTWRFFIDDHSI
jgi:hypothetical protein